MLSTITPNSSMGLAVVGCGKIMPSHLNAIAENKTNIVLRAIVDPDEDQRQEVANLPATRQLMNNVQEDEDVDVSLAEFSSVGELLADSDVMDRIHIIFLAVPHDQHEPLALQILSTCHDKLLVMEKPMATSRMSLDNLVEASQDAWTNNKMMMVITEQSPHFEEIDEAKRLINEGAIGNVITAAAYYYQTAKGSFDITGGLGWRSKKGTTGGGGFELESMW
jgi:UDP-N-acetyl-2-amino-2-deoxyglucuronate dehydrogenase